MSELFLGFKINVYETHACKCIYCISPPGVLTQFSLSHVQLFVTPWTAARQASLSIANSWSLLKFMSIESVMLSNHLILSPPSPPAFSLSKHHSLF